MQGDAQQLKAQYVQFLELPVPQYDSLSQPKIQSALQSPHWHTNFSALTLLRAASRHYPSIFLNELLPKNTGAVLQQVNNLRSNNSKEALTLVTEMFETHHPKYYPPDTANALIDALFAKSISEKKFLKSIALRGIAAAVGKGERRVMEAICGQTGAHNAAVAELACKTLLQYVQRTPTLVITKEEVFRNKGNEVEEVFRKKSNQVEEVFRKKGSEGGVNDVLLKTVEDMLNGKRAVVLRVGREMVGVIKKIAGEVAIQRSMKESQEEFRSFRKEMAQGEEAVEGRSSKNIKEFLMEKRNQNND